MVVVMDCEDGDGGRRGGREDGVGGCGERDGGYVRVMGVVLLVVGWC